MTEQQILFWVQITGSIVQTISLIFLIIYVIKTWQMASSTRKAAEATELSVQEMREIRDEETAPHIVIYFELPQEKVVYLVVNNIGKGTATNIKLDFDPPLQTAGQMPAISETPMIRDGIASMPPGYKLRTLLGSSFEYFGDDKLPLRYSVTVSYFGGLRADQRVVKQVLDLSMHKNLMYIRQKGIHELTKEVEGLVKGQNKIIKALERIAKISEDGIFINNPSIVFSEVDIDASQWTISLLAKLREFIGIWLGSSRVRESGIIPNYLQARLLLLSEQIFFVLANKSDTEEEELINTVVNIAANIREMGTMRFYADGGHSLNKFNELGDSTVNDIESIIEV